MSKLEGRRAIITVGAAGIGAVCGFGLSRIPAPEEVYDGRFLPPREARMPLA